ncbi:ATP-binding protein [Clostridium estertheticum]|uniref:AlbA family DNA-binding domain-containing protein n=1 Tax=Clostridium estertheticum TaxID=238834 RepID=UPI001C6E8134|nr:ATP-binding protein [Clostridium estertheticum]MBW9169759.1 ATP-binding protein [Clostridium estertheticum]WLC74735.1 ATP-binding protein [Clostridium estertheticum]
MELDDLIMYENENTSLDFKSIQYKREQYEAMVKDVMAMANADIECVRYIIVGIKDKSYGDKEILGIEKSEFIDSATYQQIIFENIEPQIDIEYFPHVHNNKVLGIIKIFNCNDQPYMMKKDYHKLNRGDSFIRIGSHQARMGRNDYERIYNKRKSNNDFTDKVKVGFGEHTLEKEIKLNYIKELLLPSKLAEEEIKTILKEKKCKLPFESLNQQSKISNAIANLNQSIYNFRPYEERSIEELEKNLLDIDLSYKDKDSYEFFELNSHKLNIYILNQGHSYIEDSSIKILIEKINGLIISDRMYEKPKIRRQSMLNNIKNLQYNKKYPTVIQEGTEYVISQYIGDIKHNITTKAFSESIRIVLTEEAKNQTIKLTCKIFGKNLTKPIVEELKIKVIDILGE